MRKTYCRRTKEIATVLIWDNSTRVQFKVIVVASAVVVVYMSNSVKLLI